MHEIISGLVGGLVQEMLAGLEQFHRLARSDAMRVTIHSGKDTPSTAMAISVIAVPVDGDREL